MRRELTGTRRLVGLVLRRDRVKLSIWVLALGVLLVSSAASVPALYPTDADLAELARTSAASAASLAFNGLVSGTSLGAVIASQLLLLGATGAGLMSTLLVVRHTRAEEEAGRAELIGSAVVGRHAPLTAALAVGLGANLALGAIVTLGMRALGLPVGGSLAAGLAIAFTGVAFLAVGAVAAQLVDSGRGANGIAAGALGLAFVLRAAGDAGGQVVDDGTRVIPNALSWLSPIGWAEAIRPYDDNAWWTLALLVVFAAVATELAYGLRLRRDLGAGLRPARSGPATAPRSLSGPVGLAWRLQRGTLVGWLVSVAVVGFAYGSIGTEAEDMLSAGSTAEFLEQLGGGTADLTEAFFAAVLTFMAIAAAAYAVQTTLRLRTEEASDRVEPVLASAVGRVRWVVSHLWIAFGGAVLLLAVCGATTGLSYGLSVGDVGTHVWRLTLAALAYAPAALVVPAVAVLAFGLLPRVATGIGWGVLAVFLLLGQVGVLLDLPQAVLDVSPFSHVPAVPVEEVTAGPLVALAAVAAAVTALGLAAFRRRDLTT